MRSLGNLLNWIKDFRLRCNFKKQLACLRLQPIGSRRANLQLEDHQKIRSVSTWPSDRLPRTEGRQKIKHREIQSWVESGVSAVATSGQDRVIELLQRYAPHRIITSATTLDELGLSSLDRMELMVDLER